MSWTHCCWTDPLTHWTLCMPNGSLCYRCACLCYNKPVQCWTVYSRVWNANSLFTSQLVMHSYSLLGSHWPVCAFNFSLIPSDLCFVDAVLLSSWSLCVHMMCVCAYCLSSLLPWFVACCCADCVLTCQCRDNGIRCLAWRSTVRDVEMTSVTV